MADLRLTIGQRDYQCDVPVNYICTGLWVWYSVLMKDKTAKDLEEVSQKYEAARQVYNTEQVLFNICNIGAVATFALMCLRHLSLSLTTVAAMASFWVARELLLQDASKLEKEGLVGCVIDDHKKIDPDWKANIEGIGMIWMRRMLPFVADDKINKENLIAKLAALGISNMIREGADKLQQKAEEFVEEGGKALSALLPNKEEKL